MSFPLPPVHFGVFKPIDKSKLINPNAMAETAQAEATYPERQQLGTTLAQKLKDERSITVHVLVLKKENRITLTLPLKEDNQPANTVSEVETALRQLGLCTQKQATLPSSGAKIDVVVRVAQRLKPLS